MWIFFGIVTLLFICNAFLTQVPDITDQLLANYFLTQLSLLSTYRFIVILVSIVLIAVFFRSNFDKKRSPFAVFFFSVIQTIFVFLGGILSSFILLWIIAFLHVTIFSVLFSSNQSLLGIVTDTQTIANRLDKNSQSAKIVLVDPTKQSPIIALAKAASGTDNFYGKYLLSAMPSSLIIPTKNDIPSMMLLDGTLLISSVNEQQLEEMSPLLGYILVKQFFPLRDIKTYPKLSFMTKEIYQKYRLEDENKQLANIDAEIDSIQDVVSSLSASLKENPKQEYRTKKLLSEYEDYETYFKSQKERLQSATTHVPNELGVFREPNTIQIIYDSSAFFGNSQNKISGLGRLSLVDYFEVLVHEYLHYASFASDKQRLSNVFFEEALTEYFARNIVQQSFATNTNLGYPLQATVLHEITNMYTDSELAEIYFNKDEAALANALDRVYGDNFYEDNYVLFETMMYTGNKKQALQLANDIMKKIGGRELTTKDLMSNYSN